jgi:hypothetical protein
MTTISRAEIPSNPGRPASSANPVVGNAVAVVPGTSVLVACPEAMAAWVSSTWTVAVRASTNTAGVLVGVVDDDPLAALSVPAALRVAPAVGLAAVGPVAETEDVAAPPVGTTVATTSFVATTEVASLLVGAEEGASELVGAAELVDVALGVAVGGTGVSVISFGMTVCP